MWVYSDRQDTPYWFLSSGNFLCRNSFLQDLKSWNYFPQYSGFSAHSDGMQHPQNGSLFLQDITATTAEQSVEKTSDYWILMTVLCESTNGPTLIPYWTLLQTAEKAWNRYWDEGLLKYYDQGKQTKLGSSCSLKNFMPQYDASPCHFILPVSSPHVPPVYRVHT